MKEGVFIFVVAIVILGFINFIGWRHAEEVCESKGGEAIYTGTFQSVCVKPGSIIP